MRRPKSSLTLLDLAPSDNLYRRYCNRKASSAISALLSHQLHYLCLFVLPVYLRALFTEWDAVVLYQQNTTMSNILQIKYMRQNKQWRWMDGV